MMKTNKHIRWGMIGCGDVTEQKSGPAFSKVANSKLEAVMCRTPARARDYARRHQVPRWYEDIEDLLQDEKVNAIYIATPPDSHAYYTELTAGTGRPVYVEKPMARSHEECVQMISACERAGVPLFVAYYRRRLPKFLRVKELLDTGAVGDVRAVSIKLLLPPRPGDLNSDSLPWRVIPEIAGGGYFMDLASHQFDLLDYFFGPVVEASGVTARQTNWYPAEDIVSAHYGFYNNVVGNGLWCFSISEAHQMDSIEIVGKTGKISFSCFDASAIELLTDTGCKLFKTSWPEHVQQPLIETVVEAIIAGGECPSTGQSAARTNAVLESILKGTI